MDCTDCDYQRLLVIVLDNEDISRYMNISFYIKIFKIVDLNTTHYFVKKQKYLSFEEHINICDDNIRKKH